MKILVIGCWYYRGIQPISYRPRLPYCRHTTASGREQRNHFSFNVFSNEGVSKTWAILQSSSALPLSLPKEMVSTTPTEGFASASHLRRLAREQRWEAMSSWVEQEDLRSLKDAGVSDMSYVERAMLARLRQMDEQDFAALPDSGRASAGSSLICAGLVKTGKAAAVFNSFKSSRARLRQMDEQDFAALPDSGSAEGLPTRLMRAAKTAGSLEEFYTQAKTKRYAHSRIRRLALWICDLFLLSGILLQMKPHGNDSQRKIGCNTRENG